MFEAERGDALLKTTAPERSAVEIPDGIPGGTLTAKALSFHELFFSLPP